MPRTYNVTFSAVTVTAPQDLVQVKGATGKMLRILRMWLAATDTASPTAQQLQIRARVLPTAVTDGSGGAAPTPAKNDQGDAAATFTALTNNTGKATTSGTAVVVEENGCHISAGYEFQFSRPPTIAVNQSFVFELLSTVTGTVHLSGGVTVEEIG